MVIMHSVSNMVDDISPEVIFGLIAELLHERDSWLFSEVRERNSKIMTETLDRGIEHSEMAAKNLRLASLHCLSISFALGSW